jgi:two-component system nitrate/nitrite response regulator NarL
MIDVVVCDGHPLFLDGLARVIRQDRDLRLAAETGDGTGALAAIRAHRPHVALVTEELGELDLPRLLGALRRDGVPTRVVLLHADPRAAAWEALGHGAAGVLSRRASADMVRRAVRDVASGGAALCPEAQAALAAEVRVRRPADGPALSPRELEVLRHVYGGANNARIASTMRLTESTVRTYLARVYDKLGVRTRAEALVAAVERGLLR